MSLKCLNNLWVIIGVLLIAAPELALADGAGVVLERAQVSVYPSGDALKIHWTAKNQLSVPVESIEFSVKCKASTALELMGRRAVVLAPGASVSAFLNLPTLSEKPGDCSVELLGYTLAQPTQAVLKSLLASGYSADERAALLSVQTEAGRALAWGTLASKSPGESPEVIHVLERLLTWFALAQQFSEPKDRLPAVEGIERMDQPLQVILTARERGTRLTSPLAFVLPEGVSTMKEAQTVFQERAYLPVQPLADFQVLAEPSKQDPIPETSNFYRNLSWVLLVGIIVWALWGLRRKNRVGERDHV